MTCRGTDHSAGFTLLEMLISIALLSLIMLMITGVIGFGQKSLQTTEASSLDMHSNIASCRLLSRLLERAEPVFESSADKGQQLAFSGTASSLEFLVRSPLEALPPGLYRARLTLETGQLLLSLSTMSGEKLVEKKKLDTGRPILAFAYFEKAGAQDHWSDHWSGPTHGPDLIRITGKNHDNGDQTATIDLYIRPLLLPKAQEDAHETDNN